MKEDLTREGTAALRQNIRGAVQYRWGPFMYATVETTDIQSKAVGIWLGSLLFQIAVSW